MRWLWLALLGLTPARADEPSCGAACPARGLELVVVEEAVPLSGFTVEQVSEAFNAALGEGSYITPRLSGWEPCYKCGSTAVLEGASLRYELKVLTPSYTEPASLSEVDRKSIQRWIAAVQGHTWRQVAAHREALDKVPVRNQDPEAVLAGARAACQRGQEAAAALDEAEGCLTATSLGGVTPGPISACPGKHRPLKPSVCEIAP